MKIYHDLEHIGNIKNPVVTTGSFDGVHIGHKTILNRLNEIAGNIDGESVLITFHPHPRKVLFPDTAGKTLLLINSQQEKLSFSGKPDLTILSFSTSLRNFQKFRPLILSATYWLANSMQKR